MKRIFLSILVFLMTVAFGIGLAPVAAFQSTAPEMTAVEQQNLVDYIFTGSDVIFDSFDAEAIYQALTKMVEIPQFLNFWKTPFYTDFQNKLISTTREGIKPFEDPAFLEKTFAEIYERQQNPKTDEDKLLQNQQVKYTSPNSFEIQGTLQGVVEGNKLTMSKDGKPAAEIIYSATPDKPNVLTLDVTDLEKNESHVIDFEVKDDGYYFAEGTKLLGSMVFIDPKTIQIFSTEEPKEFVLKFIDADYTISITNNSPESINKETGEPVKEFKQIDFVLNPETNVISLTVDGAQVFSLQFNTLSKTIDANFSGESVALAFDDVASTISANIPKSGSTFALVFDKANDKIDVKMAIPGYDEMMDVFSLQVNKAARQFQVKSSGVVLFAATVDSDARTVTVKDNKGETVFTEEELIKMFNEKSQSVGSGSGSVKFQ